jgi:hypothetical protein
MAKERNYTPLKELITQNPSILQKKDKESYTILTIVFQNVMQSLHSKEDLDMFDWLIKEAKCDIDSTEHAGKSLLIFAVEHDIIDVELLCQYGIDTTIESDHGGTALDIVCQQLNYGVGFGDEMMRTLLDHRSRQAKEEGKKRKRTE